MRVTSCHYSKYTRCVVDFSSLFLQLSGFGSVLFQNGRIYGLTLNINPCIDINFKTVQLIDSGNPYSYLRQVI